MVSLLLQTPMLSTCIKYQNLENQWLRNTNSRFSVYQKSCKTPKILKINNELLTVCMWKSNEPGQF